MGQSQIGAVSWRCWRRRRTVASRWSLRHRPQLRLHPNGAPRPKRMQRALLQNRELQCMHMAHTYVGMEQRCRQRHQHPHPQNLRHPPMDGPKRHQGASCELSGRHLAPRLNIKRAATDIIPDAALTYLSTKITDYLISIARCARDSSSLVNFGNLISSTPSFTFAEILSLSTLSGRM